jgi:hypothetical protein
MEKIKQWHVNRAKDAGNFLRGLLSTYLFTFYILIALAILGGIID